MKTQSKVREASLHVSITRADGTVEEIGIVDYYHQNPLKRLWWNLKKVLNGRRINKRRKSDNH